VSKKARHDGRKPVRDQEAHWRNQLVAYTSAPLTALLCFDRVLLTNNTDASRLRTLQQEFFARLADRAFGTFGESSMIWGWHLKKTGRYLGVATAGENKPLPFAERARILHNRFKCILVPLAITQNELHEAFHQGNRSVIFTSIKGLSMVDESELTLRQVIEFRLDDDASKKYQRLLRWLDANMVGKSEVEIVDTIGQKVEDYEWALNKHGIKSAIGSISELLEGKYLLGTSGVVASLAAAGHHELGLLAGAGLTIGKLSVSIATAALEYADVKRGPNSEIAWLYHVKHKL